MRIEFPCLSLLLLASTLIASPLFSAETPASLAQVPPEALELPLLDVTADPETATTLADLRGEGGLLVVFLSNTCPYVLDWSDRLPRLEKQARERGVGLALINSNARKRRATDSPEEMRRFASEHFGQSSQSYLLDEQSKLADLLAAERTPEALLFDAELKLVYRGPFDDHSGPFEKVEQHWLRDALNWMGSDSTAGDAIGAELTAPISQPVLGCKIQRPRRRAPRP